MLDVATGEVLAMVNQPAYNPNDREQFVATTYRNRAATDIFEPGSSIKPFFVAAGLASGRYQANSIIDTSPGYIQVGTSMIHDEHNFGSIPLATVLAKSSNVGMAHLALSLEPQHIWKHARRARFRSGHRERLSGRVGRPVVELLALAERADRDDVARLRPVGDSAAAGAGLRHARRAGLRRPVSMLRVDGPVSGDRVLERPVCVALLHLLESVITMPGATGKLAAIPGYRIAGKTGTAWKAEGGGYSQNRYVAVFGGVAPVSNPRLAAVVVIDEPSAGKYYGGDVSAPVFSAVLGGALRLLGVPPDASARPGGGAGAVSSGTQVARR